MRLLTFILAALLLAGGARTASIPADAEASKGPQENSDPACAGIRNV